MSNKTDTPHHSSCSAGIEAAKRDWKDGCFNKVPGDEAEFIPLPE